jgi:hypothetical protein
MQPVGLNVRVLTADVGELGNPQRKIVAIQKAYSLDTWQFTQPSVRYSLDYDCGQFSLFSAVVAAAYNSTDVCNNGYRQLFEPSRQRCGRCGAFGPDLSSVYPSLPCQAWRNSSQACLPPSPSFLTIFSIRFGWAARRRMVGKSPTPRVSSLLGSLCCCFSGDNTC